MTEREIRAIVNEFSDLRLSALREQEPEDYAIISSIMARGRELSVMESIGLEEKQIRHMLIWKSIFLILPNIVITLIIGSGLGTGIVFML